MDNLLSIFCSIPPSPTPHLLTKNDVPSKEDRDAIRDYLGHLDHFLEKAQHRSNPVTRYNVKRAESLAEVHRRLLQTSARDLPPEIIQHIAFCVVGDTRKLPWTLSWVCRAWRSAAVGYKQLWCTLPTIHMVPDPARDKTRSTFVDILACRSGYLPLKVDIRALNMLDTPTPAVLSVLLLHADRWVSAQIHLRSSHLDAFANATARMHQLRHLTLCVRSFHRRESPEPTPLLDLTNLRALESMKRLSPWPPTLLPEGTIKSYTGRMPDDDMYNCLLLLSPTLTTLTYTCNALFFDLPQGGDSAKIRFPKLKELVFSESFSVFTSNSFPFMITPRLETVKMSRCSSRAFNNFVDMIARSNTSATLTTLHIYTETRIAYASLASLFSLTPNLVELKIADDFDTAPAIHILSYLEVAPAGHLLPRLKRLTILMPWNAKANVFRSIHSIGLLRMEEPPEEQFQPDFLHRLETFEVVLLSNGPTLPHEKQERNRNIMECHWQDDLEQSVMEKLAVFQDRLYDIKKKVEVGNGNLDEVAQAATLLLGQLAALPVSLIQEVYLSAVYYILQDLLASFTLRDLYLERTTPKKFSAAAELVGCLLASWRPRLVDFAAQNRWFNKGNDILVFLRRDDPRRKEWENCLINGFPRTWVGDLKDQFFPLKSGPL